MRRKLKRTNINEGKLNDKMKKVIIGVTEGGRRTIN